MRIIKQNLPVTLPNFRNLGIILRALVLVNTLSVLAAFSKSRDIATFWNQMTEDAAWVQPVLLSSVVILYFLQGFLARLPYRQGLSAVLLLTLSVALAFGWGRLSLFGDVTAEVLFHHAVYTLTATCITLYYFHLRNRALSPAITEARLQALQARIRPHFLFNSLNAALSLIRSDPLKAEKALEDMADLFRVLMSDNRQLSTLEKEVELCKQYLWLEQLRLGERLFVAWHVDKMPKEAQIPPLILQPLLENAVYHGIEPSPEPGEVSINIYRSKDEVHLFIRNPYLTEGRHQPGNKMALANVYERLQLHFDAEARLESSISNQIYQVHITLPYSTGA